MTNCTRMQIFIVQECIFYLFCMSSGYTESVKLRMEVILHYILCFFSYFCLHLKTIITIFIRETSPSQIVQYLGVGYSHELLTHGDLEYTFISCVIYLTCYVLSSHL